MPQICILWFVKFVTYLLIHFIAQEKLVTYIHVWPLIWIS